MQDGYGGLTPELSCGERLGRPTYGPSWTYGEQVIVPHRTNVACGHREEGRRSAGCRDELHLERLGRIDLNDCAEIARPEPGVWEIAYQDHRIQLTECRKRSHGRSPG